MTAGAAGPAGTPEEGDARGRIRRRGRLLALASAVLLGLVGWAALRDLPEVGAWMYHLAWYATLPILAGGSAWRTGRWPFRSAGFAVSLFFWSAPTWFVFELLNLRLANWYYVWADPRAAVRWVAAFTAFATVMPALFLAYRWCAELGVAEGLRGPSFGVGRRTRTALTLLGVAFLGLVLWRPELFYPLVWGALTLLLEPWNHRREPEGSLLGDLAAGRWTRPARLLVGGLFIGLLWEGYNVLADTRWIYTVPGLEGGKLGEMPLPGFLGFPVLALDCFVVYRVLVGLRIAVPGWHAGAVLRLRPRRAAVAVVAALVLTVAAQRGMDRWTIDSVRPAVAELPGVPAGTADVLRDAGVTGVRDLAARDSSGLAARADLDPAVVGRAIRVARLAALRGMGAVNARALREDGIRDTCGLAGADVGRVRRAVRRVRADPNAGKPARVRVWIRAAREVCPAGAP